MHQPPLDVSSSATLGNPPLQMNLVPRQPATLDEVLDVVMRLRTEHRWLTESVKALPRPITQDEIEALLISLATTVHVQAQQREIVIIEALAAITEHQRLLVRQHATVLQVQQDLFDFRVELANRTVGARLRRAWLSVTRVLTRWTRRSRAG